VKELGGTEHRMLPDMIEIGSFIGLAALTRSEITDQGHRLRPPRHDPRCVPTLGITVLRRATTSTCPPTITTPIKTFIDGSIMNISDASMARLHTRPA
jgi:UDP-N-acetylglucosamine 1-carboxyvinyltransferase